MAERMTRPSYDPRTSSAFSRLLRLKRPPPAPKKWNEADIDLDQPPPVTDSDVERQQEEYYKTRPVRRMFKNVVDSATNIGKGIVAGPNLDKPAAEEPKSRRFGDMVGSLPGGGTELAGLPFALGNKLWHNTPNEFSYFDTARANTGDILGWMTHLAKRKGYWTRGRRNIPVTIDAKNVLDLQDPRNMTDEDFNIIAARAKELFGSRADIKDLKTKWQLARMERQGEETRGNRYGMSPTDFEYKVRDQMMNRPDVFHNTPFDAIRYIDGGEKDVWAIPDPHQIYELKSGGRGQFWEPDVEVPSPESMGRPGEVIHTKARNRVFVAKPSGELEAIQKMARLKRDTWGGIVDAKTGQSVQQGDLQAYKQKYDLHLEDDLQSHLHRKISGPGGTNDGGLYESLQGQKNYVKFYKTKEQGYGEKLANDIYKKVYLGAPKAKMGVSTHQGKVKPTFSSRWIDGTVQVGSQGLNKEVANQILDGFVADALMANYDVLGSNFDNIVKGVHSNSIHRVDNGSAFFHRAQGKLKDEKNLFGLPEWDDFADPAKGGQNGLYAEVFRVAGVKNGDALGQRAISQIDELMNGVLNDTKYFVNQSIPAAPKAYKAKVVDLLEKRKEWLKVKRQQLVNAPNSPSGVTGSIDKLSGKYPNIALKYGQDTGTEIGSIGTHTADVAKTWARQITKKELADISDHWGGNIEELMNDALALHDIGKFDALQAGDKNLQHRYTIPVLRDILFKEGHTASDVNLATELLNHDMIGQLLQGSGKLTQEQIVEALKTKAAKVGMSAQDFTTLQMAVYHADSGAYPYVKNNFMNADPITGKLSMKASHKISKILEMANPPQAAPLPHPGYSGPIAQGKPSGSTEEIMDLLGMGNSPLNKPGGVYKGSQHDIDEFTKAGYVWSDEHSGWVPKGSHLDPDVDIPPYWDDPGAQEWMEEPIKPSGMTFKSEHSLQNSEIDSIIDKLTATNHDYLSKLDYVQKKKWFKKHFGLSESQSVDIGLHYDDNADSIIKEAKSKSLHPATSSTAKKKIASNLMTASGYTTASLDSMAKQLGSKNPHIGQADPGQAITYLKNKFPYASKKELSELWFQYVKNQWPSTTFKKSELMSNYKFEFPGRVSEDESPF